MVKPWASLLVVALVGTLVVSGCSGKSPKPDPGVRPTSITGLDSSAMRLVRVQFCDLVAPGAVSAALGGAATGRAGWRDGDDVPGTGETGHEYGCSWAGPHRTAARAWVLARPVTAVFGRSLVAAAGKQSRCRLVTDPGFGAPSLAQQCSPATGRHRLRHAGLFGDTWLSCEVTTAGSTAEVRKRADAWCLAVAQALDAGS